MKVQFLKSVAGMHFNYGRGGIYSLPTSEAEYYISKGMAKKAEEEGGHKAVRPLKKTVEKKLIKKPVKKPKSKAKKVSTRPV